MPSASRPASAQKKGQMLFLVGHGLQTPLSAIRWGCSRLKKMGKDSMSKEEMELLTGIHKEAKVLSGMLNALLLVARVEDGSHEPRQQDIYLHDFLKTFTPLKQVVAAKETQISCPKDVLIKTDRAVFESLLEAISVIISTASESAKPLKITVTTSKGECSIAFSSDIELSFLRDLSEASSNGVQMVGGAPGLMLSVSSSLAHALGGRIDVEKHGKDHHMLSLQLPLRHTVPSGGIFAAV